MTNRPAPPLLSAHNSPRAFFSFDSSFRVKSASINSGTKIPGQTVWILASKSVYKEPAMKFTTQYLETRLFLYILIDRGLIYYSHIIKRLHGKRDLTESFVKTADDKKGFSTDYNGFWGAKISYYLWPDIKKIDTTFK